MSARPPEAADLGHGPRLTDEEYRRRIVRLHEKASPMPSRDEDRRIRRAELDLAVDHRLGNEFPAARRESLWQVMQGIERRRLRLIGEYFLRRLFRRDPLPESSANRLAKTMIARFHEVLDERELESFFGEEWRSPALPVDAEHRPRRGDAPPG